LLDVSRFVVPTDCEVQRLLYPIAQSIRRDAINLAPTSAHRYSHDLEMEPEGFRFRPVDDKSIVV